MSEVAALQAAIGAIWRARVYQDGNRDNGISLDLIDAIRSAARTAGFIPADAPLTPAVRDLDAELQRLYAQGVYPKLAPGLTVHQMIGALRKL